MLCKTSSFRFLLVEIRCSQCLHHTRAFGEPCPENSIRILEHAIFQTYHDELTALESRLDKPTDVLGVGEIEGSIDFIEDVHGGGFELEQCHDEGEGDEGALASGKLGKGLFPDFAETDLSICQFLVLGF